MEYNELALELLNSLQSIQRIQSQKNIFEAMQGESFILGFIANHDGDVLPSEISQKMGVTSARIANALNSLEEKGLITRQIDKKDRRQILVNITKKGKETTEQNKKAILGIAGKILEHLGEKDAKEYIRLVKKILEAVPKNEI